MRQSYIPSGGAIWWQNWDEATKLSIEVKEMIHSEQTPFQKIEVYRSDTYGTFFTLDGLMMVNEKDEFIYHEMITHVAMATNPDIQTILIIGGGDGGTSRELSKYPKIKRIDMVEIDERVVRVCETYLPVTAGHLKEDSRIKLYFEDGFKFISNQMDGIYDLIIVDSTDPIGPGEGLFTKAFYELCHRKLSPNGILINQHESPYYEFHQKSMLRAHARIKALFPVVEVYQYHMPTYPSGHWLFGFASKKLDPIGDHNVKAWEKLGIKTRYYNSKIHEGAFALPNYVLDLINHRE